MCDKYGIGSGRARPLDGVSKAHAINLFPNITGCCIESARKLPYFHIDQAMASLPIEFIVFVFDWTVFASYNGQKFPLVDVASGKHSEIL